MSDPLVGARAKIARAYEHFDALNRDISGYVETQAHAAADAGLVTEFDVERGEYNARWVGSAIPPVEWSVVLGEFFFNLRSALDHIAHVLSNGTEKSEFPIFKDEATFNSNARTAGMSDDAIAAIKALQPFRISPDYPTRTALWAIHHLCIVDKHRLLNLTELWATDIAVRWELPVPVSTVVTTHYIAPRVRLHDNAPVARQTFDPARMREVVAHGRRNKTKMGVTLDVEIDVQLAEGKWLSGTNSLGDGIAVRELARAALDHVVLKVLPAVERLVP